MSQSISHGFQSWNWNRGALAEMQPSSPGRADPGACLSSISQSGCVDKLLLGPTQPLPALAFASSGRMWSGHWRGSRLLLSSQQKMRKRGGRRQILSDRWQGLGARGPARRPRLFGHLANFPVPIQRNCPRPSLAAPFVSCPALPSVPAP